MTEGRFDIVKGETETRESVAVLVRAIRKLSDILSTITLMDIASV